MRKNSTLIYFVNSFQSVLKSVKLVETEVDNGPVNSSKKEQDPPDRIVQNILNFARSYDVVKTEEIGYVEMNLN
jgi:hypothetical protein